ncbi:MAG TPA: hypothetical protein VNT31_00285 [Nocardioides sp.]|nr:hypothetical protein [Nocardioides sp.]
MNTTADPTPDPVADRVRHALATVAGTIDEADLAPRGLPAPGPRRRRRRWALAAGGGLVVVPAALAAGAYLQQGPEYVDQIPRSSIIVEGEADGDRYLLVESRREDACGRPVAGVELVEEDENLIGSEWNTTGSTYGVPREDGCGVDTAAWLADPALHESGGTQVGDTMVWLWAVHPDVTAVRVTAGGEPTDLEVHPVDGAGYALWEIPKDVASYRVELLVGDEVVPGSVEERTVPAFD